MSDIYDGSFDDFEAEPPETGFEVDVPATIAPDYTPVYDRAIQRLREQRQGLSAKERLGALLMGFGQPTQSGRFGEALANANMQVFQQTQARRQEDEARRRELLRMENAREIAKIRREATLGAAEIRAGSKSPAGIIAAALGHKPNADETKRIGYAQRLWPNAPPGDLVRMLYHPKVEVYMMRPGVASAAASQGEDPGSAIGSVEGAVGAPTLGEFLFEARAANPGVSDADLTAYYNNKYGGR